MSCIVFKSLIYRSLHFTRVCSLLNLVRVDAFCALKFGQKFVDTVANPKTMIQFQRQKIDRSGSIKQDPNLLARIKAVALDCARVEDMVAKLVSDGGLRLEYFDYFMYLFISKLYFDYLSLLFTLGQEMLRIGAVLESDFLN